MAQIIIMPKHEQTTALTTSKETAFAIAYQAMKNLGWTIQFAGPDKLLGSTPKDWKNYPLQIIITILNDSLTVSSEMISGESFDMLGKNKKATAAFLAAFNEALKKTDENTIESNKVSIESLRAETIKAAEQEAQAAAEVDKAMHLSGSNLYVTYGIIAINTLVFILMAVNGAGIFETNGLVHIQWGSNYSPLTLSGDWWRLVTNVFIHFGIIHLLMNMYCLYTVGMYLEPMLGKIKYTAAYLCTGVLASLVSLWWHTEGTNSAGASGAIFGMYGLFLALLTTSLIPQQVRQPLLQSIGIFVVYNLVYGMKGGVDNAAHVGGLLSGFVIGYLYVFGIKKEKQEQKISWLVPLVLLLTIASAYGYLAAHVATKKQRILGEAETFKDFDKYIDNKNKASDFETRALNALNTDSSITRQDYAEQVNHALPLWDSAISLISESEQFTISTATHKEAAILIEYMKLRKDQYTLLLNLNKVNAEDEDEASKKKLDETGKKIDSIVRELKSQ